MSLLLCRFLNYFGLHIKAFSPLVNIFIKLLNLLVDIEKLCSLLVPKLNFSVQVG
ncbi:hypothetical protein DSM106972_091640 [Dulcicalothrix desertica PCC 7102]|uniref:Uncharacterized protein n=1 Tax=Dulcicalothrix desertica PCC 7102 TaxID=232991 RepID=A0A433UME2_9CYAN|nr:hypothetical protein DSM106972_091640 [Dulcicalothrix desertica PCC 7102]